MSLIRRAIEQGALVGKEPISQRRGAGVLHAAVDELLDDDLGILVPRVVDAETLAEERQHIARPAEGRPRSPPCGLWARSTAPACRATAR